AAYLFLPQVGSILTNYGFGAGCHPPRVRLSLFLQVAAYSWRLRQKIKTETGTVSLFLNILYKIIR
ncbi:MULTISPECIES: hypothetical protein, partial [unclassified Microcoleus]|uniref:hypothetical protein n=1 Tax=unclassified Microcoleus TaxID=2642155 RepID=UPI002FD10BAC